MRFILILFFLFYSLSAQAQTYCDQYDCDPALTYYSKNKTNLASISNKYNFPFDFLYAIVAPEVSHYTTRQDKVETLATEMFYAKLGSKYGNFSIGIFQMNPNFVERLEQVINADTTAYKKFVPLTKFKGTTASTIRKERLDRIKEPLKAFEYVCAMYYILELTHQDIFTDDKSKLLFYSNAYNTGFWKPKKEIERMRKQQHFPRCWSCNQYNYGQISIEFLEKIKTSNNIGG